MRKLIVNEYKGVGNSLCQWYRIKNPFRVILNFLIIYTCRYLPSLRVKNFLYRAIGIKLGRNVSVGLGVIFDIFFPELIEIGDNSLIGYNTTILTHEFLINEWRKGPVKIGKSVMIGANCLILPGVEVGDNATVSAFSLVNKNVQKDSFVGGIPVKPIYKTMRQGR
ncbi:MAG: acyltransferase [Candidatus Hydrothermarchaeota archaeon]